MFHDFQFLPTIQMIYDGTLLFGIVHGIWYIARRTGEHLESERAKIVRRHRKDGHTDRLKNCLTDDCQHLSTTN